MRKSISFYLVFTALFTLCCMASASPAISAEIVKVSCSSQIAEAYGKGILKPFEKVTKISVQLYVGPTQIVEKRLLNAVTDIIATDRPISYDMKASGYVEIPFCRDALAIITNPKYTPTQPFEIENLSDKQVRSIFSGRITNWKELGGPDKRIIVFIPGKDTGAYNNFKDLVMRINEIKYHFIANNTTYAVEAVKHVPGSISFVGQGLVSNDESIKVLKVDGLSPKDINYTISQTYSFVTKGPPEGSAKAVVNFGLSQIGVDIMRERGMFPILD